jgi:hypothetical protein
MFHIKYLAKSESRNENVPSFEVHELKLGH